MPVHKIILGGYQYLGYGLSQLRRLAVEAGQRGGYAVRNLEVDGVSIHLAIYGDQQIIRMTENAWPGYEFFTTEHVYLSDWVGADIYDVYAKGSGTRINDGIPKALFSEELDPPNEGAWWRKQYPQMDGSTDAEESVVDNPAGFSTWASWQNQKGREYTWWLADDKGKYPNVVTSPQAVLSGRANHAGWYGLTGQRFAFTAISDEGYDVLPAYYDKDGAQVGGPYLGTAEYSVWWRRAAVQEVTHTDFGKRKFFVMTDTHGRFHVYPVRDYQNIYPGFGVRAGVLPLSECVTVTPAYPAWAKVFAPGTPTNHSEFVWQFNADATRAVTIPFKREEGKLWCPTSDGMGGYTYELKPFYRNTTSDLNEQGIQFTSGANTNDGTDDTPGFLEVAISVTLTGPEIHEFDASVTIVKSSFYGDEVTPGTQRYYIDAAYLLQNKSFGAEYEAIMGAPVDSLVTAEIELWGCPFLGGDSSGVSLPIARKFGLVGDDSHYYEPGIQDALTSGYFARAMAYYVVRDYATQKELRRIPLAPMTMNATLNLGSIPDYESGFVHDPVFYGYQWLEDYFGDWYETRDPIKEDESNPEGWTYDVFPFTLIQYADLRSLSFGLTKHYSTPTAISRSTEYRVWNSIDLGPVGDASAELLPSDAPTPVPTTRLAKIPYVDPLGDPLETVDNDAAKLFMQGATYLGITGNWSGGVYVHPDGHWACGGGENDDKTGVLDIIQAYDKDGTPLDRTSHKAAFNKAFGQDRDYNFYNPDTDDQDIGGFCSFGIWKPF